MKGGDPGLNNASPAREPFVLTIELDVAAAIAIESSSRSVSASSPSSTPQAVVATTTAAIASFATMRDSPSAGAPAT